MKGKRNNFYVACYLVLSTTNKVLLLRRYNTGFEDGNYSMVAGHVEPHETIRDAMKREAEEESGLSISTKNMRVVHVMHRKTPDREYVDFFISVDKWIGEPKNIEPEKCDDLQWFDISKLPGNTIPYIRFALQKIRSREIYSEYGFGKK